MLKSEKRINSRAIVFGLSVYAAGALLVVIIVTLFGAAAAYNASQSGASQKQILEQSARAATSTGVLAASLCLAAIFTALGGYVAARRAKASMLIHALPVGLLSLFAGILFVLIAPIQSILWMLPVVVLLPVPLALAGGYAAKLGWMPLKLEEEDEAPEEDVELKLQEVADQWMLKRLRRQQEAAQSIGHLVQQRREGEREQQQRTSDEQKRIALERAMEQSKAEACEDMRKIVRQAFLSHPAATEEDFERCWPGIRDEMFKQYALEQYNAQQSPVQQKI